MANIGMVAEGLTDQRVIENILYGFYGLNTIEVHPLQPNTDETSDNSHEHSAGEFGSWQNVFKYINSSTFRGAFQYNDYVVIHIDTDVCEEKGFNVFRSGKTDEELIEAVREQLIEKIGVGHYEEYKEQIIFAIALNSIECWLLPLYESKTNKKAATINCEDKINTALPIHKKRPLNKNPERYDQASAPYMKRKTLDKHFHENISLQVFYGELENKNIQLPEMEDDW